MSVARDSLSVGVPHRPTPSVDAAALVPGLLRRWAALEGFEAAWRACVDAPIPALAFYQQLAVELLAQRLQTWGGALLADDVGLGKTRMALAVAAKLERTPLVIAPCSLVGMWRAQLEALGQSGRVCTHGALTRRAPALPETPLVIVDEAHRLRASAKRGHAQLRGLAATSPVLLLTATPLQNGVDELLSLLDVFAPAPLVTALTAGIAEPTQAQDQLLEALCVRRTRTSAQALERHCPPGRQQGFVPVWPRVAHDEAQPAGRAHDAIATALLAVDALADHAMVHGHEPSRLFATLLLHRLSSSTHAAAACLQRAANYLQRLHEAAAVGGTLDRNQFRAWFGGDPDVQLAQTVMPFLFAPQTSPVAPSGPAGNESGGHPPTSVATLPTHVETLLGAHALLAASPLRDSPRFAHLCQVLDAHTGAALIFTEYVDTAIALFAALQPRWRADTRPVGLLTGRVCRWHDAGVVEFDAVLRGFVHAAAPPLLVLSPVGAEGLNLQRAQLVVHWDLPWNPARIDQRVGRMDRLGAAAAVRVLTLLPDARIETRLGLLRTLERKRTTRRLLLPDDQEADAPLLTQVRLLLAWRQSMPADATLADGVWRVVAPVETPLLLAWAPHGAQTYAWAKHDPQTWRVVPFSHALAQLLDALPHGDTARTLDTPRALEAAPDADAAQLLALSHRLWNRQLRQQALARARTPRDPLLARALEQVRQRADAWHEAGQPNHAAQALHDGLMALDGLPRLVQLDWLRNWEANAGQLPPCVPTQRHAAPHAPPTLVVYVSSASERQTSSANA